MKAINVDLEQVESRHEEQAWDKVRELMAEDMEGEAAERMGKRKVMRVEDRFGWDWVYTDDKGTVYFGDRNSGVTQVARSVTDVRAFCETLAGILTGSATGAVDMEAEFDENEFFADDEDE